MLWWQGMDILRGSTCMSLLWWLFTQDKMRTTYSTSLHPPHHSICISLSSLTHIISIFLSSLLFLHVLPSLSIYLLCPFFLLLSSPCVPSSSHIFLSSLIPHLLVLPPSLFPPLPPLTASSSLNPYLCLCNSSENTSLRPPRSKS